MFKLLANHTLLVAFVFLLFDCSSDDSPTPEEISGFNALVNVVDAGEDCSVGGIRITVGQDRNNNDQLDSDEIQSTSFVCDGITANAPLLSTTVPELPGGNCQFGGTLISIGTDINGNNVLDDTEIQTTFFVCNGEDGTNGSDGNNGSNGFSSLTRVTSEEPGANCPNGGLFVEVGIDLNLNSTLDDGEATSSYYICNGIDGSNGSNGINGSNSLVSVTSFVGNQNGCSSGGLTINSGLDSNADGTLQAGEINFTEYVCNGINGGLDGFTTLSITTPEPAGANCPNGGTRIDIGLDDDRNGSLEPGEIDYTYYSCDGADGSNGTPGSHGKNTLVNVTSFTGNQNGCADGGLQIDTGVDDNENGVLDAVEVDATSYICDGIDGSSGSNGNNSLIQVITFNGDQNGCSNGGLEIRTGVDDNGDGSLQAAEVDATSFVCDGVNGSNGSNGTNGKNSLVQVITFNGNLNGCSDGGLEINTGIDDNNDGILQAGEIDATSFVCNGVDGTNGSPGSNGNNSLISISSFSGSQNGCSNGGLIIRSGIDDNGDGTLQAGEVDVTDYICNGSDGQNGNSDNIFEYYFTEGINGYSGTFDVSINEKDGTENGESFSVDRQTNDSHGLLYFSKIDEIIKSDVGDKFEIVECAIFLRGVSTRIDGVNQSNWIGVKVINPTSPLFDENEVTWTRANGSQDWSIPGVTSNTQNGDALDYSDMYRLPFNFVFNGYIPLLLNRSEVKAWIQEPTQNKGLVLQMADDSVPYVLDIFSSNYTKDSNFRPTLYIKAQVTTGGRVEKLSNEEYKAQWDAKSYQEKLAPIYNRR